MTLEEIVALGAFAPERVKAEQRLIAEDTDNISTCISWAHRRQHYIDQLGYVPSPSDIVSAVVRTIGGKPFFGGKQIRLSNISAVARDLGMVTKTSADAYFDALSVLVTPRHASSDTGLSGRYAAMLRQGWNEVDAALYEPLRWTRTEGTTKALILCPTGEGAEYLPIGVDDADLTESLLRMPCAGYDNAMQYAEDVRRRIVAACNDFDLDDPASLEGIPASALDTMVVLHPVKEDKQLIGYELKYKGGKYPEIRDWVRYSMPRWLAMTSPVDTPTPMSNDPDEPTYCYRNLSIYRQGEFPTICSWLDSLSYPGEYLYNLDTLAMFMYCSNVATNECKQVAWVHGAGTDAKTPFVNAVTADFGHHAGALDIASGSDHASTQIVGKNMLTISDSKNPNTLRDKLVQKITGRDRTSINPKGEALYTIKPVAKIIVTENIYPYITMHDRGQMSRLLLIDLKVRKASDMLAMGIMVQNEDGTLSFSGDRTFGPRVAAEANAFLHYGKVRWEALGCPNNLPVPRIIQERIAEMCCSVQDKEMYAHVKEWVVPDPTGFLRRDEIHSMLEHYHGGSMPDQSRTGKVIHYLFDGLASDERQTINGVRCYGFAGVKLTYEGREALRKMTERPSLNVDGSMESVFSCGNSQVTSTGRSLNPVRRAINAGL